MKKRLTLVFIYFFRIKICPDPVSKDMEFCGILSQLEKFSFLVGNEMRWDKIYQSHSRPVYASEIKKYLTPVLKFFYETKIYLNLVPNGMRSYKILSYQEKLPSLV